MGGRGEGGGGGGGGAHLICSPGHLQLSEHGNDLAI